MSRTHVLDVPADQAVRVRRIDEADWDGIVELEARAYTRLGLSEGRDALRSRTLASPDTCFALDLGPRLAGYLLALPYPEERYPDLHSPEGRPEAAPRTSRNLHLHDIVVAEDLRQRGLARHLVDALTATARAHGYERISLVAVGGSDRYWARHGYTADEAAGLPAGYGPTAVYMSRAVPVGPAPRDGEVG
ncbi:GNAT family N-acetyltransferase [Streptomyces alfalfae]|uniref:GNAT family acetyltransferase n=1 Tax=Streptomyces alfalfae TaxID=1642299 RepID=A0ABN4VSQ2_9ACTN|nr:GNAT family N-acetyltransferase [Streptomyces alfalfae]APY89588.1 GNAT family acetyltransferase [Streptomyces alfalfae]